MVKEVTKKEQKNLFLTLILAFAAIAFWRGVWGLMDLYLFPSRPNVSMAVSAAIGILILYIIKPNLNIKPAREK